LFRPIPTHESKGDTAINDRIQFLLIRGSDHLDDWLEKSRGIALHRSKIQQHNLVQTGIRSRFTGDAYAVVAEIRVGLDFPPLKQLLEKQLQCGLAKSTT